MRRWIVVGSLLAMVLTAGAVFAETCISPYIKGLRQPEKVMYLWTLPATGQGADYLPVIDVTSPRPPTAES